MMMRDQQGNEISLYTMCRRDPMWASDNIAHMLQPELYLPQLLDRLEKIDLRAVQKVAVAAAIKRAGGNYRKAAAELGIGRTTLYRMARRHGLHNPGKPGRRKVKTE